MRFSFQSTIHFLPYFQYIRGHKFKALAVRSRWKQAILNRIALKSRPFDWNLLHWSADSMKFHYFSCFNAILLLHKPETSFNNWKLALLPTFFFHFWMPLGPFSLADADLLVLCNCRFSSPEAEPKMDTHCNMDSFINGNPQVIVANSWCNNSVNAKRKAKIHTHTHIHTLGGQMTYLARE